eukprot:TRINITY_DN3766_c0_g1_i1.p1 TRINITY_DN3766_c0_g1~~TRINITY_DN3766_c0_g1_i1.p1  ORF type:complete len:272 (+),score=31.50 TRINITY_DN3766_c0_g1_i1:11-826(+)
MRRIICSRVLKHKPRTCAIARKTSSFSYGYRSNWNTIRFCAHINHNSHFNNDNFQEQIMFEKSRADEESRKRFKAENKIKSLMKDVDDLQTSIIYSLDEATKTVIRQLKKQVEDLQWENKNLTTRITSLETEIKRLKDMERSLIVRQVVIAFERRVLTKWYNLPSDYKRWNKLPCSTLATLIYDIRDDKQREEKTIRLDNIIKTKNKNLTMNEARNTITIVKESGFSFAHPDVAADVAVKAIEDEYKDDEDMRHTLLDFVAFLDEPNTPKV